MATYHVTCFYTRTQQVRNLVAHHCEVESGGRGPGDGYKTPTHGWVSDKMESPEYSVEWRKVTRETLRNPPNGSAADLPDSAGNRTLTDPRRPDSSGSADVTDPGEALPPEYGGSGSGSSVEVTDDSITIDGKSVSSDQNGDGAVDAADWSLVYGGNHQTEQEGLRDGVQDQRDLRRSHSDVGSNPASDSGSNDSGHSNSDDDGGSTGESSGGWGGGSNDSGSSDSGGSADSGVADRHQTDARQLQNPF